jgi:hypothetical protein
MIDETKDGEDSIKVTRNVEGVPQVTVATSQLPQIQVLFDGVALPYTVQPNLDAESPTTTITFGPDVKAKEVQSLLNGIH